jgi:hypothetical protein
VLLPYSGRERREHVANREGGADGSLRIVFVRLRGSEHRQDRVADELLRDASEALDSSIDETKEVSLQRPDVLGV